MIQLFIRPTAAALLILLNQFLLPTVLYSKSPAEFPVCGKDCDQKVEKLVAAINAKDHVAIKSLIAGDVLQKNDEKIDISNGDYAGEFNARIVAGRDLLSTGDFFEAVRECNDAIVEVVDNEISTKRTPVVVLRCEGVRRRFFFVKNALGNKLSLFNFGQCLIVATGVGAKCIPSVVK